MRRRKLNGLQRAVLGVGGGLLGFGVAAIAIGSGVSAAVPQVATAGLLGLPVPSLHLPRLSIPPSPQVTVPASLPPPLCQPLPSCLTNSPPPTLPTLPTGGTPTPAPPGGGTTNHSGDSGQPGSTSGVPAAPSAAGGRSTGPRATAPRGAGDASLTVTPLPPILTLSPGSAFSFGKAPFLWPLFAVLDVFALGAVVMVVRKTWSKPAAD